MYAYWVIRIPYSILRIAFCPFPRVRLFSVRNPWFIFYFFIFQLFFILFYFISFLNNRHVTTPKSGSPEASNPLMTSRNGNFHSIRSVYRIQIAPRSDLYTDGLRSTVYAIRTHGKTSLAYYKLDWNGIQNTDDAIRVHGKLALCAVF